MEIRQEKLKISNIISTMVSDVKYHQRKNNQKTWERSTNQNFKRRVEDRVK